ncbi:MAG: bifunctional 4-hydroxy-2-oxoglutarate aldolase/2-dehydro-3-deoxy-phosphogluconate aldolase [Elusimicrobia bacterium]|jgi:2-dehydro-3-deoxyphosphogluconate aldolase/(4S)-4-hydroxy-2-oxoglutarate aldolase|nr:bifunctional 4-hydroxy-2-oxoglutarate aldolase/2-dehydro-3-deoxy-phosphogluconate aldolase [Elusimicrobiota bacterium]
MKLSVLDEEKIVVIIRHPRSFEVEGVFSAVFDAGVSSIEITLNTPGAFDMLYTANKKFGKRMVIGAGTVLSVNDVKKSLDCGARFIVSPVFDQEVVDYCVEQNIPVFPGAFTPTEIFRAYRSGAYMVKIFPSKMLNPAYFKTVKAPLGDLKLMAVGGVNENNISEYIKSGADAVGVGGSTVKPEWIETGNFKAIKESLRNLTDKIKN